MLIIKHKEADIWVADWILIFFKYENTYNVKNAKRCFKAACTFCMYAHVWVWVCVCMCLFNTDIHNSYMSFYTANTDQAPNRTKKRGNENRAHTLWYKDKTCVYDDVSVITRDKKKCIFRIDTNAMEHCMIFQHVLIAHEYRTNIIVSPLILFTILDVYLMKWVWRYMRLSMYVRHVRINV